MAKAINLANFGYFNYFTAANYKGSVPAIIFVFGKDSIGD